MVIEITNTFEKNFDRINNLVSIYQDLESGPGRKPTNSLDILRATVVLLHATLEDYLRSILSWKLPLQDKEKIKDIPLFGTSESGRKTRFDLGELLDYKESKVEELIKDSIVEYLNKKSFSTPKDIATSLKIINLDPTEKMRECFPLLDEMMQRRHNIVHQADREWREGRGFHRIKSISLQKVKRWISTVDNLAVQVIEEL